MESIQDYFSQTGVKLISLALILSDYVIWTRSPTSCGISQISGDAWASLVLLSMSVK